MTGYNKGRPCLVNQHRVHLVNDGIMQAPKNKLSLIDNHIIAQVIKSQLIVCHIGDIAAVGFPSLIGFHAVEHYPYGKP